VALENGPTAETPAPVLAFLRTWEPAQNDPAAVAAVLRRPPNPIFNEARLGHIAQPVMIMNGSEDPVEAMGDRLVQALPNVRKMTLSGVGHFDLTAQPQFIARALEFLSEPDDADPDRGRGA
jgi:pimeloyl-ACP methyl ester carboxylesterase